MQYSCSVMLLLRPTERLHVRLQKAIADPTLDNAIL